MDLQRTRRVFQRAFQDFLADKCLRWAAAAGYYAVFSLGPLLLLAITVAGFVFGEQAARGEIEETLTDIIGQDGAGAVQQLIASTSQNTSGSTFGLIFGFAGLLFTASAIFLTLEDALNTIFKVPLQVTSGIKANILKRLISFAMIVGLGLLIMVSLAIGSLITQLSNFIADIGIGGELFLQFSDFMVTTLVMTVGFGALIKALPKKTIRWKLALKGGFATALLFNASRIGIAWYIGTQSVDSTFGAAGGIVLLMLWAYWSTAVFFLGVELTKSYGIEFENEHHLGTQEEADPDEEQVSTGPMA